MNAPRRLLPSLCFAALVAFAALHGQESAPAAAGAAPMLGAGAMAPDFVSHDLAGQTVRVADYRGQVLVLDFWATWCAPCLASMPHTQEIAAKYADQGVAVLAVCTGDKRRKFEDWVKLKAKSYPNLRFTSDPYEQGTPLEGNRASVALYRVPALPAQFVIGRDGRIVAAIEGYVPGDGRLEAALAKAGIRVGAEAAAQAAATEAKLASIRTTAAAAAPAGGRSEPPPFTEDAVKLKAGQPIADLALRGAEGAEQRLAAFRGRPLVLSFSPAESIPGEFLDAALARYGDQGLRTLALVVRDTPENYRDWQELHRGRHRFPTAFDPAGAAAVRESALFLAIGMITPMPVVLVLDAEGRLLGKLAPKVATSSRGLAELVRRAGLKVDPAELPTPEMMALVAKAKAAATTAATAPKTVAAPAGPTPSGADAAYAAFVQLRAEKPPGVPKEMGGMEPYLVWVDAKAKEITAAALAFHAAYPADPRRWDVVMTMLGRVPYFMKGFAPQPGRTQSVNDVVPDEDAKQAWQARADRLKQDILAAADSTPEQRETIEFWAFAAESRTQRARLKTAGAAEARAVWLELCGKFAAHVARYAGNARLAAEAENFLNAWKDAVPGSLEEGCRHFLTAPDAGVRAFAEEKLKSLERLAKPLELAFTAVDGRAVDLRALRGKVVLVDFWATWCGPCIAELPNIKRVYAELHAKGFEIIGITLENARLLPGDTAEQTAAKLEKAKKVLNDFTAKEQMPWPQHFDGRYWKNELATKYGIGAIPAMFLINQEGRVVSTNARGEALEREVRRLLKL
jgi:thiol-disulfide isomerase/thioredoxin